jgi:DNA-binding winged helix-turn-helix (wHTH) protein/Tfp pilus assembly protein PilF
MSLYEFGPFQLDAERLLLLDGGEPLPLGPKVVETLLALIEHPGEVLPKSELLSRIWPEGYVDEANLAQNIYVLRKALRRHWTFEAIETIPRRGYRFSAPVRRREQLRSEPKVVAPAEPLVRRRAAVLAAGFALALLAGSALASKAPSAGYSDSLTAANTRLYEIGRYYWNLRTRDGMAKSVAYFSRMVADDPRDARGYAGLASADAMIAEYGYSDAPVKVEIARARAYARTALAIDPDNGEAYAVLGELATETSMKNAAPQIAAALADLRRAIALDPMSGTAHEWYGVTLLEEGRLTEAYSELRTAAQLDPLSVAATAWLGTTAYLERHYRDAIAYAGETLDLSPQRADAYATLGLAYEAFGDNARAAQTFHKYVRACDHCRAEAAALLAALDARTNQMTAARAELAVAEADANDVAPGDLAVAYEAIGNHGAALTWLRRWRTDSDYAATEIANDPRFIEFRRISKSGA